MAFAAIRKFPPDSLDAIPSAVRRTLHERGCLIPQPYDDKKYNAVKGAFTAKGVAEWAVICATPTWVQAVIITADSGAVVDSLAVAIDYTIHAIDPIAFARAAHEEGETIPLPIDHDAIDVGILEKASVAYYRAAGRWYRVLTSD